MEGRNVVSRTSVIYFDNRFIAFTFTNEHQLIDVRLTSLIFTLILYFVIKMLLICFSLYNFHTFCWKNTFVTVNAWDSHYIFSLHLGKQ